PTDVFRHGTKYYLYWEGNLFQGTKPSGPWKFVGEPPGWFSAIDPTYFKTMQAGPPAGSAAPPGLGPAPPEALPPAAPFPPPPAEAPPPSPEGPNLPKVMRGQESTFEGQRRPSGKLMQGRETGGERLSDIEFGGNGDAPPHAEGLGGDLQARGRLPPFVLTAVNGPDHPPHRVGLEAPVHNILVGTTLHQVIIHDPVQDFIRRQGILVFLVGAQLRRWGPPEDLSGDQLPLPVKVVRQLVNHGLGDVGQDAQTTAHVAVKGAVAHRQFALVAGGQHHVPELVGDGHEQVAPDAGLDVFQGHL